MPLQSAAPMAIITGAFTVLSVGSAALIRTQFDGQVRSAAKRSSPSSHFIFFLTN
jgi:hypothetical protein